MRLRSVPVLAALLLALPTALPAQEINARVGKLEAEMRAVQRKVFPGGAGQVVEPDITPPPADRPPPGAPASGAITDLTQRVSALEDQLRDLTGRQEEADHRLRQLQDDFAAYRRATDARLAAGTTAPAADQTPPPRPAIDTDAPAAPREPAKPRSGETTAENPAPADPARADQIAALQRPPTGDAAEDTYLYGYRLWAAKLYPEAETQLKKVVTDYPKSKRASYAQNLLGRSYLDEGKPSLASIAFYDNYKKMPDGDRAPDSLYYLAAALMKLNKPADACKVYSELADVYGSKITADMKANVAKGRAAAKCH